LCKKNSKVRYDIHVSWGVGTVVSRRIKYVTTVIAVWDEVTGEWRKLHNEELHNLYSSPDIIRQVKLKVLVGTSEGKRPLGRSRRRWEDGIRMDLKEIGLGVDWIRLAQDMDWWWAVVNSVMNFRILAPRR
jgi:hypothetical protein